MDRISARQYLEKYISTLDYNIKYLLDDLGAYSLDILDDVIRQAREGVPHAYIVNKAHFYGYEFYVDEQVLIPRPETEELVAEVAKCVGERPMSIIDIGTGSGIIAVTLDKILKNASVAAVDISAEALSVAQKNNALLSSNVQFYHEDVTDRDAWDRLPSVDIIVSNPPYIPDRERAVMDDSVIAYEPEIALFVPNDDALKFYRTLAHLGHHVLSSGGMMFCEINEFLSKETMALFDQLGYMDIDLIHDLQGKPRIVVARYQ